MTEVWAKGAAAAGDIDLTTIASELLEKRRGLSAELDQAHAVITKLKSEIGAVDTVLRLFGAGEAPDKSVLPSYRRNTSQIVLTVLRESPRPLTALELARIVLTERHMNPQDKELLQAVARRVRATLHHFRARGALASEESSDRSLVWHFKDAPRAAAPSSGDACKP